MCHQMAGVPGASLVASYWSSLLVQASEWRDMVSDWDNLELVPCEKPAFDQIVESYLRDMMTLLVSRALDLESSARSTGCSLMDERPPGYRPFVPCEKNKGVVPACLRAIPGHMVAGVHVYNPCKLL